MLDKRTPEEKKEAADRCFESIIANGRRSCAGCHLDFYCQMPRMTAKWLFEEFLPAIDPGRQLRG